jgi:hypothetical protein
MVRLFSRSYYSSFFSPFFQTMAGALCSLKWFLLASIVASSSISLAFQVDLNGLAVSGINNAIVFDPEQQSIAFAPNAMISMSAADNTSQSIILWATITMHKGCSVPSSNIYSFSGMSGFNYLLNTTFDGTTITLLGPHALVEYQSAFQNVSVVASQALYSCATATTPSITAIFSLFFLSQIAATQPPVSGCTTSLPIDLIFLIDSSLIKASSRPSVLQFVASILDGFVLGTNSTR